MPISWTQEMSVNVKLIDEQHKFFLSQINELFASFYDMKIDEKLEIIINRIIDYAKMHFATEEKYFDKFGYEGAAEHKERHKELLTETENFLAIYKNEKKDIVVPFMDHLENWLVLHIEAYDKKYSKFFNDHGLV